MVAVITEEILLKHNAFRLLKTFPIHPSEYVIMGSGVLYALGILDLKSLEDVDLFVTRRAWEKVKNLGPENYDNRYAGESIKLHDGLIEIYNTWGPSFYSVEVLIKNAYKVGEFQFMSLEDTVRWKKQMAREEDMRHLEMINRYLNNQNQ